jgi:hypothetical protein
MSYAVSSLGPIMALGAVRRDGILVFTLTLDVCGWSLGLISAALALRLGVLGDYGGITCDFADRRSAIIATATTITTFGLSSLAMVGVYVPMVRMLFQQSNRSNLPNKVMKKAVLLVRVGAAYILNFLLILLGKMKPLLWGAERQWLTRRAWWAALILMLLSTAQAERPRLGWVFASELLFESHFVIGAVMDQRRRKGRGRPRAPLDPARVFPEPDEVTPGTASSGISSSTKVGAV